MAATRTSLGRAAAAMVAAATAPALAQTPQFTYQVDAPAVLAPGQTATVTILCGFSPGIGQNVTTNAGPAPVAGLAEGRFGIAGSGGTWSGLSLLAPFNHLVQWSVSSPGTPSGPNIGGVHFLSQNPLKGGIPSTLNPAPVWTATFTMPASDVSLEVIPVGLHYVSTWGYHNIHAVGSASHAHAAILARCYPDCNEDGALSIADFGCFQTRFVAADPYADCNGDGALTVADFGCFQTRFFVGCP